jgi:hypothetical protein
MGKIRGKPLHFEGDAGQFRFDDVPPGPYFLVVSSQGGGGDDEPKALVQDQFELSAGEERRLEFDLGSFPTHLRVLNAEGAPVRGAELTLVLLGEIGRADGTTDSDGRASVTATRSGRYEVLAAHPEEGMAHAELAVDAGAANELTLTLARGVECAGNLRLAPGARFDAKVGTLGVSSETEQWVQLQRPIELAQGGAPFRIVGLPPGKYRAFLWGEDDTLRSAFELPEDGNGALELSFTKARR